MATSIHVKKNTKWKNVQIDPNLLSSKHFDCLLSVQELKDYELVQTTVSDTEGKKKGKRKREKRSKDSEDVSMVTKHKKKMKKNTNENPVLVDGKRSGASSDKKIENKIDAGNIDNVTSKKKQKKKKRQIVGSNSTVLNLAEELQKQGQEERKNDSKKNNTRNTAIKRKVASSGSEVLKKKLKQITNEEISQTVEDTTTADLSDVSKGMEAWKNLFVPVEVLKALKESGFSSPTPIQSLVLPHAIRDKLDIIGAAETGSGKTLAFGIPLIDKILKYRDIENQVDEIEERDAEHVIEGTGDTNDDDDDDDESSDYDDGGVGHVEDSSDDNNYEDDHANIDDDGSDDVDVTDEKDETQESRGSNFGCVRVIEDADFSDLGFPQMQIIPVNKAPLALILEPTRELAVQVKNHLQTASKYSNIKVAIIVGGMSIQKQQRVLRKSPDIIVATPGRLWELMQEGELFLSQLEDIKCLVIDEADRMVEKGHFEELTKLLDHLNGNPEKKKKRQTLVFSATLTMIHSGPHRPVAKKIKQTEKDKLEMFMRKVGLKERPKVIDLTKKTGTVETLTEARINCSKEEKDLYLYYFLKQYPGRTLVFANSKDCIRRLVSLFTLLQTNPLPLHADMHQKQRLKNLERFTANEKGFLLASDVAARGLDIPNVQHVIHYQVPHTVENYVHRSGRTARASKEGLSVMLIGQEDVKNYRKIIHTLNRNEDLPIFPVEQQYLPTLKQRIRVAQQVDVAEHRFKKKKVKNDWFQKAAREMDMEIDDEQLFALKRSNKNVERKKKKRFGAQSCIVKEDVSHTQFRLSDLGDSAEQASHNQYIKQLKIELSALLRQSITPKTFSGKYPTKMGKLITPKQDEDTSAIHKVKKDRQFQEKLMKDFPLKPRIVKQKKNKWKKKWKGKSNSN